MAAQYKLLRPHYLASGWADTGTIVTEGKEIPIGWFPTPAVDPLNSDAVVAFYAAGPREGGQCESFNIYQGNYLIRPQVYWTTVEF